MGNSPRQIIRDLANEVALVEAMHGSVLASIADEKWELKTDTESCLRAYHAGPTKFYQRYPGNFHALDDLSLSVEHNSAKVELRIVNSLLCTYNPLRVSFLLQNVINQNLILRKMRMRAVFSFGKVHESINFMNFFARKMIAADTEDLCITVNPSETSFCVFNGISVKIQDINYIVYNYQKNNVVYLVIEALTPLKHKTFQHHVRKLVATLGFFTTRYAGGPEIVFVAREKCCSIKDIISIDNTFVGPSNSEYAMLSLNPYDYYANEDIFPGIGNALECKLKPITKSTFERLIDLLDNPLFSQMFYTLGSVASNRNKQPFEVREEKNNSSLKNDMKTSLLSSYNRTRLIKEFQQRVDELESEDDDDRTMVKNKIGSWLFAMSNSKKLSNPFEHVGLRLSSIDKKIISKRNLLLHGKNIVQTQFCSTNPELYIAECKRLCFQYYSLIWRLIMKHIGFNGVYRDVEKLDRLYRNQKGNGGKPLLKKL